MHNPYYKGITPEKGLKNGNCNRQACQMPGATWYNHVMNAWYCPACARAINQSSKGSNLGPICAEDKQIERIKNHKEDYYNKAGW